jgi:hypothetical protein
MSPVRYELEFYVPEEGILHSHCRGSLKSYRIASYQKLGENMHSILLFSISSQ